MGHGSSVEAPPLEVLRAVAEGQPAAQVAAKRASGYAAAAAGRESAARRLQELSSSLEGRALEQPARRLLDLSSSLEGRPLDPSRMRAVRDAARDLGLGARRAGDGGAASPPPPASPRGSGSGGAESLSVR